MSAPPGGSTASPDPPQTGPAAQEPAIVENVDPGTNQQVVTPGRLRHLDNVRALLAKCMMAVVGAFVLALIIGFLLGRPPEQMQALTAAFAPVAALAASVFTFYFKNDS